MYSEAVVMFEMGIALDDWHKLPRFTRAYHMATYSAMNLLRAMSIHDDHEEIKNRPKNRK